MALGTGCSQGSVIHELGHALGLRHENTRIDHTDFVEYRAANVMPTAASNFQVASRAAMIGDYDYGSIMHYNSHAFTLNGRPTLASPVKIGQRDSLSSGDAAAIRAIYGAACPSTTPFSCAFSRSTTLQASPNVQTVVHVTPLGGTSPFQFTLENPTDGSVTTTMATDRLALTIPASVMRPSGRVIIAVKASDSLGASASCAMQIMVADEPVCFGKVGRAGCSNHGACIGTATAGSPLRQCACDAGFARGSCDAALTCTSARMSEPLASRRAGMQAYGDISRITHHTDGGVGHANFECTGSTATAYFLEWFRQPGESFAAFSFYCRITSGTNQCWFEAVASTSPLTQLASFEVVDGHITVNGETSSDLFPVDMWCKVTLTIRYGAVITTTATVVPASGPRIVVTADVGEGDYDATHAYAVSIGCRGQGATGARALMASCTEMNPDETDFTPSSAAGPTAPAPPAPRYVTAPEGPLFPGAVPTPANPVGYVTRTGVITGVCGMQCDDTAVSVAGTALVGMFDAQTPASVVHVVSVQCIPCVERRRQTVRTYPQIVWTARCPSFAECQRVCDVARGAPGALPFFPDNSRVTCSEAAGESGVPVPAVKGDDELSGKAWFTVLMVILPLAAAGLLIALCACLVVYILFVTRRDPLAGGKPPQMRLVPPDNNSNTYVRPDLLNGRTVEGVYAAGPSPQHHLGTLSAYGDGMGTFSGWPSYSYNNATRHAASLAGIMH